MLGTPPKFFLYRKGKLLLTDFDVLMFYANKIINQIDKNKNIE